MCISVYTYVYIRIYIYIYICIHTYIYIYISCKCIYLSTYITTYNHMHTALFQFGAKVAIQVLSYRSSCRIRQIIRNECNSN